MSANKSIFVFAKRLYTQKVDGKKKVTDESLDRTHATPWAAQLSESGLSDLKFCIEESGFKGDARRVALQQACWGDMTQGGGDGIPKDYLATAIMNADVLMFQFDVTKSGKRGSLRGFCCIKYKLDQKAEAKGISVPYLYVDLICNGPLASVRASLDKASPPGSYMLAIAKALATGTKVGNITLPRMEAVQLRALETVVGYYPIFGWRFLSKGVYEACRRKKGESKKVEAARKRLVKAFKKKGDLTEDEKHKLLAPFAPWLDDFAGPAPSLKQQRKAVEGAETTMGEEGTHEAVAEGKRGDGYMMVKCLLGNDETKVMAELCEEGEKKKGVLRLQKTWEAVKASGAMVAYYGKKKRFDEEWDDEDAEELAWRDQFPRLYRASLSPGQEEESDSDESDSDESDSEEEEEEEEAERQGDYDREGHDAGRSRPRSRIRMRNCECRCRSYGKKRTKKKAPRRARNRRLTQGRSRPRGGRRTRRR